MIEIEPTQFRHDQEKYDTSIRLIAPYTMFEPLVVTVKPDGSIESLGRESTLSEMKEYFGKLGVEQSYSLPFGGSGVNFYSVGEVIDTNASSFLEEANGVSPAPEAMVGILTTVAKLAERSGFDRNKARFTASFLYPATKSNPNLSIHSDGLSGLVLEDTTKAKSVRFVYALGPGSLVYPGINEIGEPMDVNDQAEEGIAYINSPTDLQLINSARGATFTQDELINGGAQQVLPGVILGFDPVRTFWHQAPNEPRPILAIDVQQAE